MNDIDTEEVTTLQAYKDTQAELAQIRSNLVKRLAALDAERKEIKNILGRAPRTRTKKQTPKGETK